MPDLDDTLFVAFSTLFLLVGLACNVGRVRQALYVGLRKTAVSSGCIGLGIMTTGHQFRPSFYVSAIILWLGSALLVSKLSGATERRQEGV